MAMIMFYIMAGLTSHVVYPNGISCTLPEDIQKDLVRTIPGLEQAKLLYPGICNTIYSLHFDLECSRIHESMTCCM